MLASLMAALAVMLAAAPVRAQSAPGAPVFVENAGQWETPARFVLRSGGLTARVEPDGLWLDRHHRLDDATATGVLLHWTFEGASPEVQLVGEQRASGVHHYLLGNDRSGWRTDVRLYNAVRYQGLYPGVDLLLRWQGGHLEYDLRLFPGADLGQVRIRVRGGNGFRSESDGTLVLDTANGPLRQGRPMSWEIDGSDARHMISCEYAIHGGDMFGFSVPDRDPSRALVIDPGLEWAASLGGSAVDNLTDMVLGGDGGVYICGFTSSPDFPTTPGAISNQLQGLGIDAFVSCLGDEGQTLVFSTYLGGPNGSTSAEALALAGGNEAVVVGKTSAPTFPVTPGVVGPVKSGISDAFITRLNDAGSDVVVSTFYGGSLGDGGQLASDDAFAVGVDADGIITVAGSTSATDFPTTSGAFQEAKTSDGSPDGFVLRLSADASQVIYSTFLGGNGVDFLEDLALYSTGEVVVAGWGSSPPVTPGAFDTTPDPAKGDGYVAKLSADGSRLVYGTFLGGSSTERASAVAAGPNGEAVVVGQTLSIDFPVTPDAWDKILNNQGYTGGNDAFVTRLDATGCCLLYSTYFGGGGDETDFDVALQSSGAITIAGSTWSQTYPTTPGAYQTVKGGLSTPDAFVARIHPSGQSLVYSTYLGGSVFESKLGSTHVALDGTGAAIVTGTTNSPDFPLTPGTIQSDPVTFGPVFVAKLDLLATGVSKLGASTPGAGAPLAIGAISMPQVGHDGFAVSCTDAPPLAAGILAVSLAPFPASVMLKGAGLWLDPTAFIALAPQTSDATGYSQARLAVPDDPRLEGLAVYAQYLWPDPAQAGLLVASNALEIVVQS